MKSLGLFFGLLLIMVLVAACNGTSTTSSSTTPSDASTNSGAGDEVGILVQVYLQARVDTDEAKLRDLTCAAQEASIPVQAGSFRGREGKLNNVTCTFDGTGKVSCTGSIDVTYDGEVRQLPIPNYSVVQEDGVWKVCGEAE